MTKKKPGTDIPGKSSNQHIYQERTQQVSNSNAAQRKPFPSTDALTSAIQLECNRHRAVEEILAEAITSFEAEQAL